MKRCAILLLTMIGLAAAEFPTLTSELVCEQIASPTWVGTPPADAIFFPNPQVLPARRLNVNCPGPWP